MTSDDKVIQYGLPQRSVLSLTLFNINTNALFSLNCNGEGVVFPDGTAIFFGAHNWYSLTLKAEKNVHLTKKRLNSK